MSLPSRRAAGSPASHRSRTLNRYRTTLPSETNGGPLPCCLHSHNVGGDTLIFLAACFELRISSIVSWSASTSSCGVQKLATTLRSSFVDLRQLPMSNNALPEIIP